MSCFTPLVGAKIDGVVKILSGGRQVNVERYGRVMELPCGRCVGCKQDRARAWQLRICHEAQLYDKNLMLTLTYRDEDLPPGKSLVYRDFQLFMKRLRFRVGGHQEGPEGGRPLRFFCAGEYGGRTGRPHYHAILFNLWVKDERWYPGGSGWSGVLEEIWQKGHVRLDPVTPGIAGYVAGYINKAHLGPGSAVHYEDVVLETGEVVEREREFCQMSRSPGLGTWWYAKNGADLFPHDAAIVAGGNRYKVPRFYTEKWKVDAEPEELEKMLMERRERAFASRSESTPERRAVREEVMERRIEFFQERGL